MTQVAGKARALKIVTFAAAGLAVVGLVASAILATMADEQHWTSPSLPLVIGGTLLFLVIAVGSFAAWMGFRVRASAARE